MTSLLVVPLGKALNGIAPYWSGRLVAATLAPRLFSRLGGLDMPLIKLGNRCCLKIGWYNLYVYCCNLYQQSIHVKLYIICFSWLLCFRKKLSRSSDFWLRHAWLNKGLNLYDFTVQCKILPQSLEELLWCTSCNWQIRQISSRVLKIAVQAVYLKQRWRTCGPRAARKNFLRPANILARPALLNIFFPSNLCDAISKAEPLI